LDLSALRAENETMTRSVPRVRWRARPHRGGSPPDPRFSFANERTFLAWNRTAMALIGGGLAASQLLHFGLSSGCLLIALLLIALGAAVGTAGIVRWRASELAMRRGVPVPRSPIAPLLLGGGAGLIAVVSIAVLVVDQLR
jgi:putative membrane protein